jgi:CHAT domain-containing protein
MSLLFIRALLTIIITICLTACSRTQDPNNAFEHAQRTLEQGNIAAALDEAEKGYREFHKVGTNWAWQFVILRARLLHWQGKNDEMLKLVGSEPSAPPSEDLAVQKARLVGAAYASLHRFTDAEEHLSEAEQLCAHSRSRVCTEVISAWGVLEMERGNYAHGQEYFERALTSARGYHDEFWVASSLLNLSWAADEQAHFDNALDWANAAREASATGGFADFVQTALGNMGWAYYKLGDSEQAKSLFNDAEKRAAELENTTDELRWLTAAAYAYLDSGNVETAQQSFRKALDLAKGLKSPEDITNSLIALAFVSEKTNKLAEAKGYADQALAKAQEDKNGRDQVYPLLVQGRIAARQHDTGAAEKDFHEVADSKDATDFLKWEAERSLARLYEEEKRANEADREYQTALTTFEAARSELRSEHSSLTFLSNATRIYDDYIHLLISRGKIDEALRVANYDRARTLREGLGLAKRGDSFAPEPLNAQAIARRAGGTILFYWLGEKRSYLWVITPRTTRLFPLNASSAEIDAAVHGYRTKLEGPPEILEASDDGSALYKMLIEPARDFLAKEALAKNNRIFIIPDGSLNSLNFETLTPAPKHYWIEDVTITSAGSLHLLAAARPAPNKLAGRLLLIGNPVSPTPAGPDNHGDNPYPELPNAAAEMHSIEQHFPPQQRTVFAREQATPAALNGHPEQFSYIHFVAHGTASRTSPLDSAIILSRDPASKAASGEDDSFKLYGRDIIQHPLHAELVTISACYGAGRRSYSGEGLVGLSWAFLRAGAHNVVGALWDVSSISSAQLMDDFYGELQKGKSPSAALRAAKLSLLHSDNADFRRPFYWAPFQLYTGS